MNRIDVTGNDGELAQDSLAELSPVETMRNLADDLAGQAEVLAREAEQLFLTSRFTDLVARATTGESIRFYRVQTNDRGPQATGGIHHLELSRFASQEPAETGVMMEFSFAETPHSLSALGASWEFDHASKEDRVTLPYDAVDLITEHQGHIVFRTTVNEGPLVYVLTDQAFSIDHAKEIAAFASGVDF